MAGIALCIRNNNDCPNKDNCLRYTEVPNVTSAYMDFPVICNQGNSYPWKWNTKTSLVKVENKEEPKNE